jgi:fructan beta-fructosidase
MSLFKIALYSILLSSIVMVSSCKNDKAIDEINVSSIDYYNEAHRPQFHFSPDSMWMNDPNGMVYFDGEYHLFYQYYPDSIVWGPMHWGHAVSSDLLHWKHLPIALYPDSLGLIFSGSAVIDHHNTAGFGKDAMVAIFTHHNMAGEKAGRIDFQYQSIAYSLDKGRCFIKYSGNPVIKNPGIKDFRDPKVIWHEKSKKWILVLAAYDKVMFYTSPNLKDWTYASEFGIPGDHRLWECPDLFPIKVEGTNEQKWVLITSIQKDAPNGGTATSYFVGDFDGEKFTGNYKNQKWLDYGTDNYALVTWSNVPDGRTLALGWMSNWQYAQKVPTQRWRSAMTIPRTLHLYKENDDYNLRSFPIAELNNIKKSSVSGSQSNKNYLTALPSSCLIDISVLSPTDSILNIRISNENAEYIDLGYDPSTKQLYLDRTKAGIDNFSEVFAARHTCPRQSKSDTLDLKILLDHSSIEMFADNGRTVMTDIIFPSSPYTKLEIMGKSKILDMQMAPLSSVWR